MPPLPKMSFGELIQTSSPFLSIPELETRMRDRVNNIVDRLMVFEDHNNPRITIKNFLKNDRDFLGVLLALTNLSQEKLLRIISAQRHANNDFGNEWNIDAIFGKISREDAFAFQIADLFIGGRENQVLRTHVSPFILDQLSLPANWTEIISDRNLIANVVRKKLMGEYSDLKGEYVEQMIMNRVINLGHNPAITHGHGQVQFLGKEVDVAIPSLEDPKIMIMSSYTETTSSSQTARANEQSEMYQSVIGYNVRYARSGRIFVNVVDGSGWLARRPDLRKLHSGCDYILNINTLDRLDQIVLYHLEH